MEAKVTRELFLADVTLDALARDDAGIRSFVMLAANDAAQAAGYHRAPDRVAVTLAQEALRHPERRHKDDVRSLEHSIVSQAVQPVLADLLNELVEIARGLIQEPVDPQAVKAAISLFGIDALPLPGVAAGGMLDWYPAVGEARQRIGEILVRWERQAHKERDKDAEYNLRHAVKLLLKIPRLQVRRLDMRRSYAGELYRWTRTEGMLKGRAHPSDDELARVAACCGLAPDRLRSYVEEVPRRSPHALALERTAEKFGVTPAYLERRVLAAPFVVTLRTAK